MTLNLVQHRSGPSLWDRDAAGAWDTERWLLAILAGAFFVAGVRRRSMPGLLMALGGASLGWLATTTVDVRRIRRAQIQQAWPRRSAAGDPVMDASEDSFPASDAPSWTPTTGNR